jgi:hypothetical protein
MTGLRGLSAWTLTQYTARGYAKRRFESMSESIVRGLPLLRQIVDIVDKQALYVEE